MRNTTSLWAVDDHCRQNLIDIAFSFVQSIAYAIHFSLSFHSIPPVPQSTNDIIGGIRLLCRRGISISFPTLFVVMGYMSF
jgi:hypothetical protein